MRKKAYILFATTSLALLFAAISVHGQYARLLVADIPFNFTVKNRTLPAGQYTVEPVQIGATQSLRIRSRDGHINVIVPARSGRAGERQAEPKLTFSRFGEQYFMHQASGFEGEGVYTLTKSRTEEALARGEGGQKRETISITGRAQGK